MDSYLSNSSRYSNTKGLTSKSKKQIPKPSNPRLVINQDNQIDLNSMAGVL